MQRQILGTYYQHTRPLSVRAKKRMEDVSDAGRALGEDVGKHLRGQLVHQPTKGSMCIMVRTPCKRITQGST